MDLLDRQDGERAEQGHHAGVVQHQPLVLVVHAADRQQGATSHGRRSLRQRTGDVDGGGGPRTLLPVLHPGRLREVSPSDGHHARSTFECELPVPGPMPPERVAELVTVLTHGASPPLAGRRSTRPTMQQSITVVGRASLARSGCRCYVQLYITPIYPSSGLCRARSGRSWPATVAGLPVVSFEQRDAFVGALTERATKTCAGAPSRPALEQKMYGPSHDHGQLVRQWPRSLGFGQDLRDPKDDDDPSGPVLSHNRVQLDRQWTRTMRFGHES
jgi:hypothetical protein